MVQPTAEVIDRLGLRTPEEFAREEFGKFMVKANKECETTVVETACFMEPHAWNSHLHVELQEKQQHETQRFFYTLTYTCQTGPMFKGRRFKYT